MTQAYGAVVPRLEDPEMLRGDAVFVADMELPGMVHMAILRSPHGHAAIKRIDTTAAQKMPGVIRVVTSADIEGKLMPLPCIWVPGGVESHFPPHPMGLPASNPVLATDRVRFIGDAVAAVVAGTRRQALAAVDKIVVDYELLPAVVSAKEAVTDGAPQLHEAVPKNLNAYWTCGDSAATDKAIEQAEVVVSLDMYNQRTINSPIEPRAAIGRYDPSTQEFTLWATSQSPHNHRLLLAFAVLGVPFNKIRLISPNIGGSFGTKGYLYPDMALVMWLSRELGRPVKWVDTREGMMRSTVQGRDHQIHATLAGTRDGRFTALRATSYANLGAYPSTIGPGVATAMIGRSITGCYAIPVAFAEVYAAFTNTVPLGAQRGSGRAEATHLLERLVDQFAAAIGLDKVELRRKNLVQPDQFPYDNGLGWLYDSGDYETVLNRAVELSGYGDLAKRKAQASARGKRLGMGISCFVAISGVGPSPRMAKEGMLGGTWEGANVRLHPTGEVTIMIGATSTGQSHRTVFAQVAAEQLQVDPAKIEVLHSDTHGAPYGQGSYGSRSFSVCGPAVRNAAAQIRAKVLELAGHMLEVAVEDLEFQDGKVWVRAAPERSKTLQEIAIAGWYGWDLPPGMEPNWDATTFFDPPDFNYPFGAQVATVEIDEQTGKVELVDLVAVCDVGTVANPRVVEGQVHGGLAHGVGQALFEQAVYDTDGHLLTGQLTSYPLPRASWLPDFETERTVTPTPHNALGSKGAGEIGTVGATAAIANAVVDALGDLGVTHIDMPFTPEQVWKTIAAAKSGPAANGGGAR
ncbi:MAG TPA: xanthine dehydrogenase family protein molybdopterin-binding subunit [Actinomycetota bacterium]|nr:xanthine dehydrogenase family protein molybdopterin-binding subunit [Actinomycetota bacterium]